MFKSLLAFWSGKDFLSGVLDDFSKMLEIAEKMYQKTLCDLLEEKEGPKNVQEIYDLDKQINELERGIRQRIVSHLAVQSSVNTNVCLVLMSVTKDAERVGDYLKNFQELTLLIEGPLDKTEFRNYFQEIPELLGEKFARTRKAFVNSDEKLARQIIRKKLEIGPQCDQILKDVAASDLPANRAACYAVLARTLKRITGHLANIATAVVMPVTGLDYYDEDLRKTSEE